MSSENKMKEIFEKVKVNAFNIASITLSIIAIILSIVAISGNVQRRNFRPNWMNYNYESRMSGQNFNQNPNNAANPQDGINQRPQYFAGPMSPSVGYNGSKRNGSGHRSFKRIGPRNQQGMDAQSGPTTKAFPSPQDQQKPQGPNEQQNNTTN